MFARGSIKVLLALSICIISSEAGVVLQHNGSADPVADEGWTVFSDNYGVGDITTGPINDNGTAAWFVDDNSSVNGGKYSYYYLLDSADLADGLDNGWTMDVSLRVVDSPDTVDPAIWAGIYYNHICYELSFGSQSDGDPIVVVGNGETGPSYVLEGTGGGYHDYSLVYDPAQQTVDLFVDESEVISNVAGRYWSGSSDVVRWGSAATIPVGHANYSYVSYAIPEPASLAIIGLSTGGFIFIRRLFNAA